MKKPNFFIVGAPKCGTTALNEYLKLHPEIFIVSRKEPHYFNTDIPKARGFNKLERYLELYKPCKSKHIAVGEASVWYLYSNDALDNIYQFNPNAKIIIMVRNPIDMAYSLFSQLRYNLEEDQESFENAWHLQKIRKQGKKLPILTREAKFVQYGQVCKLSKQIERAYSIFPKEQIKVIIFDDFVADTRHIYQETLSFLGLNDDGKTKFPVINESNIYNIKWLQKFIYRPPKFLAMFFNRWKPIRDITNFLVEQIKKWNSTNVKRPPLSDNFRQELADYFRDDVKKLSQLLDRDLTHWLE